MLKKLMEKSGFLEVTLRRVATFFSPLKRLVKRKMSKTKAGFVQPVSRQGLIDSFKKQIKTCNFSQNDIVIVHSSYDGLKKMGLGPSEIIDTIIQELNGATVLFAAFPIEPRVSKSLYKYDPSKTICWTGILPNLFLKRKGVVRTPVPYNSLASFGRFTEEIMKDNLKAVVPHGEYTPWHYCYEHHAKILFVGTTSRESNTMAIHMPPDIMKDDWPIEGWYERRKYLIKIDRGHEIEREIQIQKGFWYRYVNEYKTDKALKNEGLVTDISVNGIAIEYVSDCNKMLGFLIDRCKKGKLMYLIPRKYYKKGE